MNLFRSLKCQWDRATAVVLVVVGLVALGLGWLGISDAVIPTEQMPYIVSGAVFGLFALGAAATLWLSADLRDEWRKLDDIYQVMQSEASGRAESSQSTTKFVSITERERNVSVPLRGAGR